MAHGDLIIADATHTCVFSATDNWSVIQPQLSVFSIAPADLQELVNLPTRTRPDLLVGKVFGATMRLPALDVGLEPLCSTVIHRVVTSLDLDDCQRTRLDGDPDVIRTPRSIISGTMPTVIYHGTSDLHLPLIQTSGLCISQPSNWTGGGRNHIYLAAEAQVSAFHARRTAELAGGDPIVLECLLPTNWGVDHDVQHQMVVNPAVPSADPLFLSQEAGLFAVPADIPWSDILEVRRPVLHTRFETWPIV